MRDAPLPAAALSDARATRPTRRFRRRLALLRSPLSPDMTLLAAGLFLPNLLSLVSLTSLVDIGLPPRTDAMMLYATVAVCARRLPFAATVALFLGVLAFDMVRTLSLMFGLAPTELLAAIDQARRIRFFASPLYLSLIAVVALTTLTSLHLLRSRRKLTRANLYLFAGATLLLASLDYVTNYSIHYQFGSVFGRGKPVASAAELSGFNAAAGSNGRNVVLVLVEGLGYLKDPLARSRITAPLLDDPRITGKYDVTSGSTVYYGSTTAGEMRELCNTRDFYADFAPAHGHACLPSLLRQRGYTGIAVHAFAGGMFERETWYPQIGFDRSLFGEELGKQTKRYCGGAFHGLCDADLAPAITAAARQAAQSGKPRFLYWVTLNTHVPVAPGDALTDFQCAHGDNGFGTATLCRMAELWHDLFRTLRVIALDPAVWPADILVVGDHAPPMWSKRGRAQFAPGQVAWYRLSPRAGALASASGGSARSP